MDQFDNFISEIYRYYFDSIKKGPVFCLCSYDNTQYEFTQVNAEMQKQDLKHKFKEYANLAILMGASTVIFFAPTGKRHAEDLSNSLNKLRAEYGLTGGLKAFELDLKYTTEDEASPEDYFILQMFWPRTGEFAASILKRGAVINTLIFKVIW